MRLQMQELPYLEKTRRMLQMTPGLNLYVTVSIGGDERTHEKNRRVPDAYARSVHWTEFLVSLCIAA